MPKLPPENPERVAPRRARTRKPTRPPAAVAVVSVAGAPALSDGTPASSAGDLASSAGRSTSIGRALRRHAGYPHDLIDASQPHGWPQVRDELGRALTLIAVRQAQAGVFD